MSATKLAWAHTAVGAISSPFQRMAWIMLRRPSQILGDIGLATSTPPVDHDPGAGV